MPDAILFGPFRLDPDGRLCRGNHAVQIRPRPLALLRHLAARPGVVVSRAELLASVWGGVHVGPGAVKVAMRALRAALEDDAEAPRWVETVGRRGYRFVGDGDGDGAPPVRPPVASAVGRAAELATLAAHLARAGGGIRQTVFVTGEPGIGKTTLVDRFLAAAAAGVRPRIARGECQEHYGPGEAYLPIHDALRALCAGPDGGEALAILRRCAPSWLAQQPSLASEDERAALQRTLHGATQERLLRELAEAIEVLSAARALVLVLEDLQWSDASTIDLVTRLAQRRDEAQLLILATYRSTEPGVRAHPVSAAKRELAAKRLCAEIALGMLSPQEVAAYVAPCTGAADAASLGRAVHERTGGNPLFVANVVDELWSAGLVAREEGAWRLRADAAAVARMIPSALHGLIEKQLARLEPAQRAVLEAASVVGREHTTAAVAAALRDTVEAVDEIAADLAAGGHLVEAQGGAEWPDGTISSRYRFRHALYVDVLRERIAPARLARMHRLIGERTEAGYGTRAAEHATLLAAHFEAGHRRERAEHYHDLAGDGAMRQSAHREALAHFQKALELAAARPSRRRELALHTKIGMAVAAARGYTAPEAEQAFAHALALSEGTRESTDLFPAYRGLREYYLVRGDIARAGTFAERLARLAAAHGDPTIAAEAEFSLGSVRFYAGDLVGALARFERALAVAPPAEDGADAVIYTHDPAATTLSELALTLWLLGRPEEANVRSAAAVARAEGRSHPLGLAHALSFDAVLHQGLGAVAVVRARAAAVRTLAIEHGFPHWLAMSILLEGWSAVHDGDPALGVERLEQGIAATQAIGAGLGLSYWRVWLAQALGATGRGTEGLEVVTGELVRIAASGERAHESALHRMRGELLLAAGSRDVAEIEACFGRALDVARRQGARGYELPAALRLAELWRGSERARAGRELVVQALAELAGDPVTPDATAARRWLADGGRSS